MGQTVNWAIALLHDYYTDITLSFLCDEVKISIVLSDSYP